MRISTRLHLIALLPILSALLIGLTLRATFSSVREAKSMADLADGVIQGMFELNLLTYEYAEEREKRGEVQWGRRHESLARLVKEVRGRTPEEGQILDRIRGRLTVIGAIFAQFAASNRPEEVESRGPERSREWQDRLIGQMMVTSQSMVSDAKQLGRLSRANSSEAHIRANWLIMATLIFVTPLMTAISFWIGRSIRRPVEELRRGTETIAAGDLDHAVHILGRHEISQLAQAFNEMTQGLKSSYADLHREISERKRAERELQVLNETLERRVQERTAELSRSNESLQQFAYVASHDLQEPLRAVEGYAQVLARRYQGKLDEQADRFVSNIVEGVDRMKALIGGLLDYSRVGAKAGGLEMSDAGESVSNALMNLETAIRESGARITRDGLPQVRVDAAQFTQVFQNLIGNAIKFRGEVPPEIEISARRTGDEKWQFAVRDNGIGMEPQYHEKIFVIFRRLHTRESYRGTGIGLALCKRIVERHGGEIWVESEPGEGSTFFFTIPDTSEEPPDA